MSILMFFGLYSIWKNPPTPITHPGSQRGVRYHCSLRRLISYLLFKNQATNQRMSSHQVQSPYDSMGSSGRRGHTREPYGNTTASRVVFGQTPVRSRKSNNFVQGIVLFLLIPWSYFHGDTFRIIEFKSLQSRPNPCHRNPR